MQNKVLNLQVRMEQENEVKIKLRVENGGRLPKLDGRRAQEHLVKHGRRRKIWYPLSPKSSAKCENWPRLWLLKKQHLLQVKCLDQWNCKA